MVNHIPKHYPPAYYRYRKNHPVISVVLTKELKELLDEEKKNDGVSYSQLIMKFIKQGADVTKYYDDGYAAGIAKGYADGLIDGNDEGRLAERKRLTKLK